MIASSPRDLTVRRLFIRARRPVYDAGISGGSHISDEELLRAGGPSTNGASAHAPSPGFSRLLVLGYILAISIPPLGLVAGVAVGLRLGKTKHAVSIILISLVTAAIWVLILTSGSLDSASSTDY
jgi:hypothetical protein